MLYERLAKAYKEIESTSKRLEKTAIIAQLLQESGEQLDRVMVLLQGRVFAGWDKEKIGVSSKLTLKALARVTGKESTMLEREWSKLGDLGLVAEKHVDGRSQQTLFTQQLTVQYVHEQIKKLAATEGSGSVDIKMKLLSELLSQSTPVEARYITRTVLEDLRIGIASGTLRDAIIYAFLDEVAGIKEGEIDEREKYNTTSQVVQAAIDRTNDFATVARAAQKGIPELEKIKAKIGTPLKVMLGIRGGTIHQAFQDLTPPILWQFKYDGFRCEIHKQKEEIQIFTRRLENVTQQFPDIVKKARESIKAESAIIDAEAIGVDTKTGRYMPFQHVSQRIKRKHGIKKMAEKLPVEVRCFDIIYKDGEETLQAPMGERHRLLENTIQEQEGFKVAQTIITSDEAQAQEFFEQALKAGTEGLFAKATESIYQPGTRVGNWIKIKTVMEPIDAVVIEADWGEGKRSGWLTSFTLAIRDENEQLQTIGKAATGLKEIPEEGFSFPEITKMLKPLIQHEEGRQVEVKPEIILEVAYEEIQKSPSYSSGYALRFPRIKRDRTDERAVEDITTLDEVKHLFQLQHN